MHFTNGLAILLLVSAACSPSANGQDPKPGAGKGDPAASQPSVPAGTDVERAIQASIHGPLHTLLRATVRDGLVDYDALATVASKRILADYLDGLAGADTTPWSKTEHLAALINLYNATMVVEVVERRGKDSKWTPAANEFAVFDAPVVRMPGAEKPVSLNHLENEVIRKQWSEPRIHVALVCAAKSCPLLIPRGYIAEDLEQTLQDNMERFIKDESRNEIDGKAKTLRLSKLFQWYAADFGGPDGVTSYVDPFVPDDVKRWSVEFKEYDWSLNIRPSKPVDNDKK